MARRHEAIRRRPSKAPHLSSTSCNPGVCAPPLGVEAELEDAGRPSDGWVNIDYDGTINPTLAMLRLGSGGEAVPPFRNWWSTILWRGREYRSAPLTEAQREVVEAALRCVRFALKGFDRAQCFANPQKLIMSDGSRTLVYVEGFCQPRGFPPLHHGWAALDGKVIDPTAIGLGRHEGELGMVLGEFKDCVYFGVPIQPEYVERICQASLAAGTLLDPYKGPDFKAARELLRTGGAGAVVELA